VNQAFLDARWLIDVSGVQFLTDAENIEIYADPLLPRIFYSLIENSVRHGNSKLTRIKISAYEKDDSLILIYDDDGPGIPDEKKASIFDPGYGDGTGLSLFIIREILSFTGLAIAENGIYGRGTRLEIIVPHDKYRSRVAEDLNEEERPAEEKDSTSGRDYNEEEN
jgi:signal transduction histidine kinase